MTGHQKLESIALSNLEASELNTYDIVNIDDMVGTIKSVGLLTPLTVVGPYKDNCYRILSGERRFTALKKIAKEPDYDGRFDNVPCLVISGENTDELLQKLIIEVANLEVRDNIDKDRHRFTLVNILKKMADEGRIEEKQIVSEMGKCMKESERYRRMYVTIFNKGTDETKNLVLNKDITIAEGSVVSQLPKETQDIVAAAIKEGTPKKDVMDVVQTTSRDMRDASRKLKEMEKSDTMPKEYVVNQGESNLVTDAAHAYDTNTFIDEGIGDIEEIRRIASGEAQRAELEAFLGGIPKDSMFATSSISSSKETSYKGVSGINKWIDGILKKRTFTEEEMDTFDRLRDMLEYVESAIVAEDGLDVYDED